MGVGEWNATKRRLRLKDYSSPNVMRDAARRVLGRHERTEDDRNERNRLREIENEVGHKEEKEAEMAWQARQCFASASAGCHSLAVALPARSQELQQSPVLRCCGSVWLGIPGSKAVPPVVA